MYRYKVFSSLRDIPEATWESLLQGRFSCYSYAFWQLVEQSRLNDFTYRYILFFDENDAPVALAGFYSVTTDIAIFAPPGLRGLLAVIRRAFPNFLKLRMLECGTPITLHSPPFVMGEGISHQKIIPLLHEVLLAQAKAEGQLLIVVRDFEPGVETMRHDFTKLGYHWVDNLPNTYMDIIWATPEDYLASMKSYYRSKLLKHLRRNDVQKISYERVEDFYTLAETLCAQWMVVYNQADEFQREVLTPEFYRQFSAKMGPLSNALLFYQDGTLVAHALLLKDGDLLRWLYFGRTEAVNDSLYIYVGHKVVETAIMLKAKRLEMGLTTYSIKQDLGAQVVPLKLAVRAVSKYINLFVGLIYPLLNHTPKIENKNIFKQQND